MQIAICMSDLKNTVHYEKNHLKIRQQSLLSNEQTFAVPLRTNLTQFIALQVVYLLGVTFINTQQITGHFKRNPFSIQT